MESILISWQIMNPSKKKIYAHVRFGWCYKLFSVEELIYFNSYVSHMIEHIILLIVI